MHELLSPPSPHRRRLFAFGLAAWTFWTAWFVVLFQPTPSQWPVAALVMATALGAFASSAVVIEVRRALAPCVAWSDRIHFRWVLALAAVLFVVKLTGISLAVSA